MSIHDEVNAAVRAELDRACEKNNNTIVMVSLVGDRGYGIVAGEKAEYEVCYTYTRGVEDYLSLGPARMLPTMTAVLLSNGASLTITSMDIKDLLGGFLVGDLNCLELPFKPSMAESLGYRDEWWVKTLEELGRTTKEYAEQWLRPHTASDQYFNRFLGFSKGIAKDVIPEDTKALLEFDLRLMRTVRYGMCSIHVKACEQITVDQGALLTTVPDSVSKAWMLAIAGLGHRPMAMEDRLALLNMVKTLEGTRGTAKLTAHPTPRLGDPRQLSSFFRWVIGYRP